IQTVNAASSNAALAESAENDDAAERKKHDSGQGRNHHYCRVKVKKIGANGPQGEDYARPIEPERTSYGGNIRAQAKLEKQRGGDESRAAARIRIWVGRGFGHEVPSSDLYRSLGKVFKYRQET